MRSHKEIINGMSARAKRVAFELGDLTDAELNDVLEAKGLVWRAESGGGGFGSNGARHSINLGAVGQGKCPHCGK